MKIATILAMAAALGDVAVSVCGRKVVASNMYATLTGWLDESICETPKLLPPKVAEAVALMGDARLHFGERLVSVTNDVGTVRFNYGSYEPSERAAIAGLPDFVIDANGVKALAKVAALSVPYALANPFVQGANLRCVSGTVYAAGTNGAMFHKVALGKLSSASLVSAILPSRVAKVLPRLFPTGCSVKTGESGVNFVSDGIELRCAIIAGGASPHAMMDQMVAATCMEPAFSLTSADGLIAALQTVALTGERVNLSCTNGVVCVSAETDPDSKIGIDAEPRTDFAFLVNAAQLTSALSTISGGVELGETCTLKASPLIVAEKGTANGFLIAPLRDQAEAAAAHAEVAHA